MGRIGHGCRRTIQRGSRIADPGFHKADQQFLERIRFLRGYIKINMG